MISTQIVTIAKLFQLAARCGCRGDCDDVRTGTGFAIRALIMISICQTR
jgi:hypothetical protein